MKPGEKIQIKVRSLSTTTNLEVAIKQITSKKENETFVEHIESVSVVSNCTQSRRSWESEKMVSYLSQFDASLSALKKGMPLCCCVAQ